jgi:hypothetical protein
MEPHRLYFSLPGYRKERFRRGVNTHLGITILSADLRELFWQMN